MSRLRICLLIGSAMFLTFVSAFAQEAGVILSGPQLARVTPTSFYYVGQSAPTQMRNTAAVRFGTKRFVVAGMVDTSGYSTEIQATYQGFFITDSPISINGSELGTGAYGFGFSADKMNIFDVGGNSLLSVNATKDSDLKRPRPLMMMKAADGVRLYSGRSYVVISAK
jgi:hypothetical protein